MEFILPLLLAASITVALIPLLARRAGSLHVLDGPGPRKVHDHPVPRVGGIAMAAGASVPLLLWLPAGSEWAAYLAGAAVIFAFGVWDDRRGLPPSTKLLGQAIGVGVVLAGGVGVDSLYLGSAIEVPSWMVICATGLFLLGITNAINLADGLDGLAGGTSAVSFAAIAALAYGHDLPGVTTVSAIMLGCLLGFLRFNSHPARIFMGDGGSQLLGFTLGVVAIELTQSPEVPYSATLPLLLLGLPIIDMLAVIVVRLREGRSPFSADRSHLHHRLLKIGFDHFEAVVVIYCLQLLLMLLAWWMRFDLELNVLLAFTLVAGLVIGCVYFAEHSGWQWQGAGGIRLAGVVEQRVPWLKAPRHLPRWGNLIAWACLSLYAAIVAVTADGVSADIAWLAAGLAGVMILAASGLVPGHLVIGPAHAAAYVAVLVLVYVDHVEVAELRWFWLLKWLLFPVLTAAVILRLRFWRERRFEITTLDVLIVLLALVVPNLPGLMRPGSHLGLSVAKLVVLLYSVELLVNHSERVRRWLWSSLAGALGILALREFF